MIKFTVAKPGTELRAGEYVVGMPTFLDEVNECSRLIGRQQYLTANAIRTIADKIAYKYDKDFNAFTNIIAHEFDGRPYKNMEDVALVMIEVFQKQYPKIFDSYLDTKIKNRPYGCKLIYFTGSPLFSNIFYKNGIEEIKPKDIEVHLGLKKKKTVGKPFVSKEETKTMV